MREHQQADHSEHKHRRRLDSEHTPDIEARDVEFAADALFFKQARADEEATDAEEKVYAEAPEVRNWGRADRTQVFA